jgi:hypothetical protein
VAVPASAAEATDAPPPWAYGFTTPVPPGTPPAEPNHAFGPDEIRVLTSAFDNALRKFRLADQADPATEVVAKKIIELERDPLRLSERAIRALSL